MDQNYSKILEWSTSANRICNCSCRFLDFDISDNNESNYWILTLSKWRHALQAVLNSTVNSEISEIVTEPCDGFARTGLVPKLSKISSVHDAFHISCYYNNNKSSINYPHFVMIPVIPDGNITSMQSTL